MTSPETSRWYDVDVNGSLVLSLFDTEFGATLAAIRKLGHDDFTLFADDSCTIDPKLTTCLVWKPYWSGPASGLQEALKGISNE